MRRRRRSTSPRRTTLPGVVLVLVLALALAGCGDDDSPTDPPPGPPETSEVTNSTCLVRLHGRSERGSDPVDRGSYAEVAPTGNGTAGEGYEWRYDSTESFGQARDLVADWIDVVGCERVVVNGFSNGGGFAGALLCSGESFGDRLAGVVIDDPVVDDAVEDCAAAPGVEVALYWTGALVEAEPGVRCDEIGYTCGGDVLLGIDAYADALGVEAQPSPVDEHRWFRDAPELPEMLLIDSL